MVHHGLMGRATYINAEGSGKVHGARLFSYSSLFPLMNNDRFAPRITMDISGGEITPVNLGDPVYARVSWLVKPSTGHLDRRKELFNYHLSSCRMTVECSFGRLKDR